MLLLLGFSADAIAHSMLKSSSQLPKMAENVGIPVMGELYRMDRANAKQLTFEVGSVPWTTLKKKGCVGALALRGRAGS